MRPVVIAGCGDLGGAVGKRLAADGRLVVGIRREAAAVPPPVRGLSADLTREPGAGGIDPGALPDGPATLIYTVTPEARTEDGYDRIYREAFLRTLASMPTPPAHVVYVSSTSVYDVSDGSWVDEQTPPNAAGLGGVLIEAEHAAASSGVPATIVRPAGIYGPGRTMLIDRVREGRAVFDEAEPVYTNRIHRDDLAELIASVVRRAEVEAVPEVICAVDLEPAPRTEVNRYIAELLEVPAESSDAGGVRARGNKRVRSRVRDEFLPELEYPTYREGYRALLESRD